MLIQTVKKKVKSWFHVLYIKYYERKFEDLPYLFFRKHSDRLLIVFSAFAGNKRRYNYVRGFRNINADKLYILDPWGYRGSYNLFDNGSPHPQGVTQKLISKIISWGGYKEVYTAGTSKGGTCALFYGLKNNVTAVFTGACQYNVGNYVFRLDESKIFYGMMGNEAGQKEVDLLNRIVRDEVFKSKDTKTIVHVIYSKKEPTYENDIKDLLKDLTDNGVHYIDLERGFEEHSLVAEPFAQYVNEYMK